MDFINKKHTHWNEYTVPKMKHFALVSIDQKERVINAFGEHWNSDGPKTKKELVELKHKFESVENPCAKFVWCKTDFGKIFYEVSEEDIPDNGTTKLDKYLVISIDECRDKTIDKNPVKDEFDLWDLFCSVSGKVSRLECYWSVHNKSRIPEIYELKEGFITQKLDERWDSYDIISEPVEYNARADKAMLDEIVKHRKETGVECPEFVTMGDAFEYFLKKFE